MLATIHFGQNLLSSLLLSTCNNMRIRLYKTIILPVVLYGYETCSLTLRVVQSAEKNTWNEEV
jgi:hypothetical protein